MTSQVKGLVLLYLLIISVVGSNVPSSLNTTIHETFSFPQMEIAVTAKIVSQPGVQLCVESVAVHSWQRDFHGLHERPPCLVQHSGLI